MAEAAAAPRGGHGQYAAENLVKNRKLYNFKAKNNPSLPFSPGGPGLPEKCMLLYNNSVGLSQPIQSKCLLSVNLKPTG